MPSPHLTRDCSTGRQFFPAVGVGKGFRPEQSPGGGGGGAVIVSDAVLNTAPGWHVTVTASTHGAAFAGMVIVTDAEQVCCGPTPEHAAAAKTGADTHPLWVTAQLVASAAL